MNLKQIEALEKEIFGGVSTAEFVPPEVVADIVASGRVVLSYDEGYTPEGRPARFTVVENKFDARA